MRAWLSLAGARNSVVNRDIKQSFPALRYPALKIFRGIDTAGTVVDRYFRVGA